MRELIKPKIRLWKVWIVAFMGVVFSLGAAANTPFGYMVLDPVNAIADSVGLVLGYLLAAFLIGNFFEIKKKEVKA